ncbi:MAG: hypothetical protein IPJ46_16595 [Anaerolineales bacterium]|nr:hypothetical protein [Anaerolineales bacterium]
MVMTHCYLIYSTAMMTYVEFYFDDMARFHPVVPLVNIILVVSQVNLFSKADMLALSLLRWRAESSGHLKVIEIILKGNIGRDFSSVKCGLNLLQNRAKIDVPSWFVIAALTARLKIGKFSRQY